MSPTLRKAKPMAKRSKDNLRIKRKYLLWRKDARGISEASLDKTGAAITLYDTWLGGKDFRAFHAERARSFKRHLSGLRNERTGAPLSAATMNGTLRELKGFFFGWLISRATNQKSAAQMRITLHRTESRKKPGAGPCGNRIHHPNRFSTSSRTCRPPR